jgi:hypothetical protein
MNFFTTRISCARKKLYIGAVDEPIQMMPSLTNNHQQLQPNTENIFEEFVWENHEFEEFIYYN